MKEKKKKETVKNAVENKEKAKVTEVKTKNKSKKIILMIFIVLMSFVFISLVGIITYNCFKSTPKHNPIPALEDLPKPEADESRDFGIDKNINEKTIDKYLGRSDTVYRDMRMLEDPAAYENIGGDRYLSGYIDGFEVIPLPYIIPVSDLPEEVGKTYEGITLFYPNDGGYVANYEESFELLEKYFPKDKNIFLMCGGGGYAGMMKNFLISMGWDADKIYNVGGFWYYEGEHRIDLKRDNESLDFEDVPYIGINFNSLTKSVDYKETGIKVNEIYLYYENISVEEGLPFELDYYILPYNASNKEVTWKSSNENVATVSDNGLVRGINEGTATITVTSNDQGKTNTCIVNVTKRMVNKIDVDDVTTENKKINNIDLDSIDERYYDISHNQDGTFAYPYNDENKYQELMRKRDKELEEGLRDRAEILNSLVDNKKTFVMVINRSTCGDRVYNVAERVPTILEKNNYSFIDIKYDHWINQENLITISKMEYAGGVNVDLAKNTAVILIVKEGKVIAALDPDKTFIYNESDLITWLTKYIDLK